MKGAQDEWEKGMEDEMIALCDEVAGLRSAEWGELVVVVDEGGP
jgi:hypothetical protein